MTNGLCFCKLDRFWLSQAHRIIYVACKPWNPLCALDYISVVEDAVRKSRTCCWSKMIYGERRPWGSLWLTIFPHNGVWNTWKYLLFHFIYSVEAASRASIVFIILFFFNSRRLDCKKRKLNSSQSNLLTFNGRTSLLVSMWRSLISQRSTAPTVG